ncbi:hypothetical protein SPRG_14255 [Saprolegnia parasitica CBS 223.65]|uniref:Uncharacterized protein n=1 Tax=Saprolegnia parasitica (strain CBS 223.65) TaxID=695850 RepID=A0A067BNC8_SAPPC|nr:hypothetical protein SPRG_14255 [Saprolegnia parasitica CBS 223.65]KDO19728.1 hypothetical protein SPRG_14255 [Saprolegnia parasitica CBS 223.65]|eukprot:XP_012209587.1 hypothetical protein SPRG_14255 [Saprolegnia parasitica CBS 223.65]
MEAEMYQMTQHLKAYAHSYDESLQDDAELISSVADRAQANLAKLDSENARLEVHLNNGLTVCTLAGRANVTLKLSIKEDDEAAIKAHARATRISMEILERDGGGLVESHFFAL